MGYSWYRVDGAAADHPKVMELAALLGNAEIALADGYVMRLWSWAQRYAPDGSFPARAVPQLERYLGREGVLGLMTDVGLVDARGDTFCVHDWAEMQGALVEKSTRDAKLKRIKRRANGARPAPTKTKPGAQPAPATRRDETDVTNETERDEGRGNAPRPASLAPVPQDLVQLWNGVAHPDLPRCAELTDKRMVAAKARLRERSLPVWRQVIERINASAFCRGANDRAWVATFDWLLQPDVAVKALEGKYDDRAPTEKPRIEPQYVEGKTKIGAA